VSDGERDDRSSLRSRRRARSGPQVGMRPGSGGSTVLRRERSKAYGTRLPVSGTPEAAAAAERTSRWTCSCGQRNYGASCRCCGGQRP
jgi:hypothetical protein